MLLLFILPVLKIGDEEHKDVDIPDDQLPEGYLTPAMVQSSYVTKNATEAIVQERLREATEKQRETLLDDSDHVAKVREKHGLVEPGQDPPDIAQRITTAQDEVRRTEVKPLEEKLETANTTIGTLHTKTLDGDILAHATRVGFQDHLLKPGKSGVAPVVQMKRDSFMHSKEYGYWVVKGPDGKPEIDPKATEGKPYLDVAGYFDAFATDKGNAEFLKQVRQTGAEQGPGKPVVRDGVKFIDGSPESLGKNLEEVAKGEVKVAAPE